MAPTRRWLNSPLPQEFPSLSSTRISARETACIRPAFTARAAASSTPSRPPNEPTAHTTSRRLPSPADTEPSFPEFHTASGHLATPGIAEGQPFAPDEGMTAILTRAARVGNAQLRVQSRSEARPSTAAGGPQTSNRSAPDHTKPPWHVPAMVSGDDLLQSIDACPSHRRDPPPERNSKDGGYRMYLGSGRLTGLLVR